MALDLKIAGYDVLSIIREQGLGKQSGLSEGELDDLQSGKVTGPNYMKFLTCLVENADRFPAEVTQVIKQKLQPAHAQLMAAPPEVLGMILSSGMLEMVLGGGAEGQQFAQEMHATARSVEAMKGAVDRGHLDRETAGSFVEQAVESMAHTPAGERFKGGLQRLVDEGLRDPLQPDGTSKGKAN